MSECDGIVNLVGSGFRLQSPLPSVTGVSVCVCASTEKRQAQSLTSPINHTLGLIDSAPVLTLLPHQILKEASRLLFNRVLGSVMQASINCSCSLQKTLQRGGRFMTHGHQLYKPSTFLFHIFTTFPITQLK